MRGFQGTTHALVFISAVVAMSMIIVVNAVQMFTRFYDVALELSK